MSTPKGSPGGRPTSRRGYIASATSPTRRPGGLQSSMHSLSINEPLKYQIAKKPAPGKAGKAVQVITNHFKLNTTKFPEHIYKWDVDIKKSNPTSQGHDATVTGRVKRRVLELLLKMPGFDKGVYTDYEKTLISFNQLTPGKGLVKVVSVDYYEPEESAPRTGPQRSLFDVTIQSAASPLPTQPLKDLMVNNGIIVQRAAEYEEALNIILLRFAGQNPGLTTAGRGTKVFPITGGNTNNDTRRDLGKGLWAYRGYSRRVRILNGGLQLCVNTTASVMYEEGWLASLTQKWQPPKQPRAPTPVRDRIIQLEQFLKRLRVQGKFHTNRVKPIWGLAHTSPPDKDKKKQEWKLLNVAEVKFHCDKHPKTGTTVNTLVSVGQWYFQAYAINLNPQGLVVNVGNDERPMYWPVELCYVMPGQSYKRLLPFSEQAQVMITFACRNPPQNISYIHNEGLPMLGIQGKPGQAGSLADSPLDVWMSMSSIGARRIAAPELQIAANKTIPPSDTAQGQWNLKNRKFKQGAIKGYTVLVFRRPGEPPIKNIEDFRNGLARDIALYCNQNASATKCIRVPGVPEAIDWPEDDHHGYLSRLFDHCGRNKAQYFFIVPSDTTWYPTIKRAADAIGVQTTISVRKKDHSVKAGFGELANLMLKYNLKCGGLNWSLNMANFKVLGGRPAMFMGADVIHPPPGAMPGAPSCAALVASIGPNPGQFPCTIRLQHHPDQKKQAMEMILGLDKMVEDRLKVWKENPDTKGVLPGIIIMYRDGVSDEQLQQTLDRELPLLMQACKEFYGAANQPLPKIIWQVCQKRHIVRFYAPKGDTSGSFDGKGNPLPGLIVDQHVTTKDKHDWYATSHKCLQGTSVPAHHYLLYDEVKADVDALQQLTFAMSYIFGRSVTSISVPAPAKLADRLCERAKYHLHEVYFPKPPEPGAKLEEYDESKHFKGQKDISGRIVNSMYYI